MVKIIIDVTGGLVQSVKSNDEVEVLVIDHDYDGQGSFLSKKEISNFIGNDKLKDVPYKSGYKA